jgi:hypothetical protein
MPDVHDAGMGEEIELAAKVAGESIEALAKASGVLGPVKMFTDYLRARVYYRHLPNLAHEATKAAQTIERLKLPRAAVSDKLVLAILEEGSREEDESMQERWANLIANAATMGTAEVRSAFPRILSELEPGDAATLDRLASHVRRGAYRATLPAHPLLESEQGRTELGNLNRLGLLDYVRTTSTTWGDLGKENPQIRGVQFTDLGWAFLRACRTPQAHASEG